MSDSTNKISRDIFLDFFCVCFILSLDGSTLGGLEVFFFLILIRQTCSKSNFSATHQLCHLLHFSDESLYPCLSHLDNLKSSFPHFKILIHLETINSFDRILDGEGIFSQRRQQKKKAKFRIIIYNRSPSSLAKCRERKDLNCVISSVRFDLFPTTRFPSLKFHSEMLTSLFSLVCISHLRFPAQWRIRRGLQCIIERLRQQSTGVHT